MPRNSNGTYSLPAGNPVVTGTVISSTWANSTLSDIGSELTDSLDRSGKGGMLAPLQLASGLVGAPGLSWTAETTSGLYRAGAGDFRYSISSTDKLQLTTNGLRTADGAAATPAYSFLSDTNSGMYSVGADQVGLSVNGVGQFVVRTTNILVNLAFIGQDGSAASPMYSFSSDADNGLFRLATNQPAISAGGVRTMSWTTTQTLILDGLATAPGVAFDSDPDTGIYRVAANQFGIATAGALQFDLNATRLFIPNAQLQMPDGTSGAPSHSFSSDTDVGMYRSGANSLSFSTGGTVRLSVASSGAGVIIEAGNAISGPNGTAGAPTYTFTGDPDTGMFLSAANTITLAAAGSGVIDFTTNSLTFGTLNSGVFNINITNSNSATAGGVASLPATVRGYWTLNINGSSRKIPYYDP